MALKSASGHIAVQFVCKSFDNLHTTFGMVSICTLTAIDGFRLKLNGTPTLLGIGYFR